MIFELDFFSAEFSSKGSNFSITVKADKNGVNFLRLVKVASLMGQNIDYLFHSPCQKRLNCAGTCKIACRNLTLCLASRPLILMILQITNTRPPARGIVL